MNEMNVWSGFTTALSKYATFSGRARRMEYWGFSLFVLIISFTIGLIPVLGWIVAIALIIPDIAVTVRRLHDIGKSGLNYFWIFLPIIGWIMLLIWYCQEGDKGNNMYGADPKGGVGNTSQTSSSLHTYDPRDQYSNENEQTEDYRHQSTYSDDSDLETLMAQGTSALAEANWEKAVGSFNQVLRKDNQHAPAYIGLLCAELKVRYEFELSQSKVPIEDNHYFKEAIKYADAVYRSKLYGYSTR
jgi:uncharacterized membrane protein YhaH (DUF805 family)